MRGGWVVAVAMALVVAGCSGSGVSDEEHDQALTELALAQQDILEARRQLVATAEENSRAAELEDRIDQIIRDNDLVLGAQQDPLEELARLVADFHEREAALMTELETFAEVAEQTERPPTPAVNPGYGDLLRFIVGWLAQAEAPDATTLSLASDTVATTGDADLQAAWDELSVLYAELDEQMRRQWLVDLAEFALAGMESAAP